MAFTFNLELADGAAADPPTFTTVATLWRPGDAIPLGGRTLRVVDVRDTRDDGDPVLVVEDVSERASSGEARYAVGSRRPG
jgi:hypothetical protein